MEEKNFVEIPFDGSSLLSSAMVSGGTNITSLLSKMSENYEVMDSFIFGERFRDALVHNLVTSFSLRMFQNKKENTKGYLQYFFKFKVCLRIPVNGNVQYVACDYTAGIESQDCLMKFHQANINSELLPTKWLNSLKVTAKKNRLNNQMFWNADLVNVDALIKSIG